MNEFVAIISTAGPVSAFQEHGHTIAQIEGLQTVLDDLGGRVEDLEAFIPSSSFSVSSTQQTIIAAWELPEIMEVFPTRTKIEAKDVPSIKPADLPREGGLLPAVYTGDLIRDYVVTTNELWTGTNPEDFGPLRYWSDIDGWHVWHGELNGYDEVTGDVTYGTVLRKSPNVNDSRWVLLVQGEGGPMVLYMGPWQEPLPDSPPITGCPPARPGRVVGRRLPPRFPAR